MTVLRPESAGRSVGVHAWPLWRTGLVWVPLPCERRGERTVPVQPRAGDAEHRDDPGFRDYVTSRSRALLRVAFLLTRNLADAEDLVQALSSRPTRRGAVLRYYEDMSEAEIAEARGISLGTVKSTVSRAVAKLRIDAELLKG
jgi:DNA-directed RNA polymerase specialized sigma24 family protein